MLWLALHSQLILCRTGLKSPHPHTFGGWRRIRGAAPVPYGTWSGAGLSPGQAGARKWAATGPARGGALPIHAARL